MKRKNRKKRINKVNPFSFNSLSFETKTDITTEQYTLFNQAYVSEFIRGEQISLFDVEAPSTENKEEEFISIFDLFGESKTASSPAVDKKPVISVNNYKITDYDIGKGSAQEKFERNIKAIELLKSIESEQREATADEQAVLAQYVGWGGLSACFAKDTETDIKLQEILTESEYRAAKASMLTAYYTPPVVIEKIYEYLSANGFSKGNVLEPCCGIGNFFGMLPDSMAESKLYGIELDSISARIAELLYPNAKIQNCGFEKSKFQDNYFDVAIGNVPFGQYGVADLRYDHMDLLIHDYFFVKTIDLVRPGGVIAFITSKGTMDKSTSKIRKYISQRCDLLGAIRLPNTTFKASAGTSVTSDIIFLKKRDNITTEEPLWICTQNYVNDEGDTINDIVINSYFSANPSMILGDIKIKSTQYGRQDLFVKLKEGTTLKDELNSAIKEIESTDLSYSCNNDVETILADESVKNYSYYIDNGELFYRKNSIAEKAKVSNKSEKRIRGMIEIRDLVYELLERQQDLNADLSKFQSQLNSAYDLFVIKYGRICDKANNDAFRADTSIPLLRSLEVYDNKGNFVRKADIFTKRTIIPETVITHCDSATDALGVSLVRKGKVDLEFISSLTGLDKDQLKQELDGQIFAVPHTVDDNGEYIYVSANEYLSGNVVKKLEEARRFAEFDKAFTSNVEALEKVQPIPLEASDINIKLGATWINPDYYNQFIYDLLKVPMRDQKDYNWNDNYVAVEFCKQTASYNIRCKGKLSWGALNTSEFGTTRRTAIYIIEDSLNQRTTKIFDYEEDKEGKIKAILNEKETQLAQAKQESIKQRFREWLYENIDRRNDVVATYNRLFNCIRPREYDGSHLTFSGMNPNIQFYDYQRNAVARSVYGGNTLLAHCVGAGKTYEMIASIMEGKKLGKNTKALVVVPNHLTEQFGNDFLTLYPSANILVATKKDFSLKRRQELISRISTCNFDAVIIGHSQLLKVALSPEYTMRYINKEIAALEYALSTCETLDSGKSYSERQIELQIRKLQKKLEQINSRIKIRTDDVLIFEQLGIDKLVVDEAHYFKNLQVATKMSGVAGVNSAASQKASDLFYKCQYINELTDNQGLIFATGTPVSNTMTEIFTMQKYLQSDVLEDMGLEFFDAWAAQFGEVVSSFELAPEGTGFRMKERFAKFYNLPELMNIFKLVADIKTSVDVKLDVPDCELKNVIAEPSDIQKDYVQELSKRASDVHKGLVDRSKDNMLKICSDGRKCGLDQRLLNPLFPDDEQSKLNTCVNNIYKIWNDTKDERLTQLVFCDLSTPHTGDKIDNSDFANVYFDVKEKLMARGIPSEEIAFVHDYPEDKKEECFAEMREGNIRILLGSTNKLGVGTNVQTRLVAMHDLDIPWRPSDLEQRLGRMVRQGNRNDKVYLYRYTTKGTFDAYLYQILEAKQRFISQIMSSENPVRSCDNVDEVTLSFAEIKALCSGNPLIKEKLELDVEVKKLELLKSSFKTTKYRLENELVTTIPGLISKYRWNVDNIRKDLSYISENYAYLLKKEAVESESEENTEEKEDKTPFEMVIEGVTFTKRNDAAKAFSTALAHVSYDDLKSFDYNEIGSYMGMPISIKYDQAYSTYHARLKGNHYYIFELGASSIGAIRRIENRGKTVEKTLELFENKLRSTENQIEQTKNVLETSYQHFPQQEELDKKSARLRELNALLSLDSKNVA